MNWHILCKELLLFVLYVGAVVCTIIVLFILSCASAMREKMKRSVDSNAKK